MDFVSSHRLMDLVVLQVALGDFESLPGDSVKVTCNDGLVGTTEHVAHPFLYPDRLLGCMTLTGKLLE